MKSTYRKLFSLHSWLGLITGIFLLVLGITGSILVYRIELNQWLYDPLIESNVASHKVTLDSIYHTLAYRYNHLRGMALLSNPDDKNHVYEFRVYTSDDKLHTIDLMGVMVDPHTGKIVREGYYRDIEKFPINWIFSFHYSFMLGNPGMFVTALFGLTMLLSLITGGVVYRKFLWKALTFRVAIKRKNWRVFSSDLHRVVGVWALALNALIFFTGFWLNRFMFEPAGWKIKPPVEEKVLFQGSVERSIQSAKEVLRGFRPDYIHLPVKQGDQLTIYGQKTGDSGFGTNTIHFESNGVLSAVHTPASIVEFGRWFDGAHYALHVGNFGGTPVRIIYIMVGLTPGLLSVTGFMLWWRRRKKRL
ncbi:MAG: PepSY domain-containing protein [Bacteroidetes bacterium]|nr:PepSY domain-containing protein [Bacteroidota bacterium]